MFCKENYKVVIIMRFLLHQNIIYKMFLVDDLLNIRYLLELWRLIYIYIYIMFFLLLKEVVVLISWDIRNIRTNI
jgi:hypothetical protein